jgi:thioredoxin 1
MKHPSLKLLLSSLLLAAFATGGLYAESCCATMPPASDTATPVAVETPKPAALPRLVDLGASKCIPCKMMAPILDELAAEYKGQMEVVFIDVWKDRQAGQIYGIQAIPTQIFFSAEGKELYRHTGFYPKADILAKWKELGVELKATEMATK